MYNCEAIHELCPFVDIAKYSFTTVLGFLFAILWSLLIDVKVSTFLEVKTVAWRKRKMEWNFVFLFNSVLLGVGLAMDAFSVSMANGLNEPGMKRKKMCGVAGVFAFFQALMPMIGWVCVHTVVQYFAAFEKFIPWIALILLCYIGGKMLWDGIKNKEEDAEEAAGVGLSALLIQGVATSIDALSVGFTIADYGFVMALVCALIIAVVTFVICMAGLVIGKTVGTKLSNKAAILGGVILIFIGIEIFVTGVF